MSDQDPPTDARTNGAVDLHAVLAAALDHADETLRRRMGRARTSVTITVDGRRSVTLRCESASPTVEAGASDAQVRIDLDRHQAGLFAQGRLNLPALVVDGTVPCEGPVRRFLTIVPIVQGLVREVSHGH